VAPIDVQVPLFPATNENLVPPGFKIDPAQALAVAKTSPEILAIHRAHHPLGYAVYVWVKWHYEVYFFFHHKLIADQIVTADGKLGQTYTGPLILGVYARGHYGGAFDSPWVLLSFGLMFLLPLARLRRRSWIDVLDLAMLLSFGISYALFDHGHVELSVWLFYPSLLYFLVRMLIRGWRPEATRRLDCALPTALLVVGLLALIGARVGLALAPPHVMDVGIASAIGASKILHGQSIYYPSIGHPDTYGPIAYLAYVPFEAIWPKSWSYLPAARGATITFDLLTIGALLLLGMRLRPGATGRRQGLLLAWLWAACPFTLLGIYKGTNDGLVALVVVLAMLWLAKPVRRGAIIGLGAAAKFFPVILLGVMLVGRGGGEERQWRKVLAGFVIAAGVSLAVFLPPGGLGEVYDHTIGYQLTRTDIFSIWALHPTLAPLKVAVEVGVVILAVVLAIRPRGRRGTPQVSAIAAALTIAVQLPALHWFYLYIVWFLPLVLIAVLGAEAHDNEEPPMIELSAPPVQADEAPALLVT
jgi:hypothetical protein